MATPNAIGGCKWLFARRRRCGNSDLRPGACRRTRLILRLPTLIPGQREAEAKDPPGTSLDRPKVRVCFRPPSLQPGGAGDGGGTWPGTRALRSYDHQQVGSGKNSQEGRVEMEKPGGNSQEGTARLEKPGGNIQDGTAKKEQPEGNSRREQPGGNCQEGTVGREQPRKNSQEGTVKMEKPRGNSQEKNNQEETAKKEQPGGNS